MVIEGVITAELVAVVFLTLRGTDGTEVELPFTFDFPFLSPAESVLADGSVLRSGYYGGIVLRDGKPWTVPVFATEGKPLMGMKFVENCHVVSMSSQGLP